MVMEGGTDDENEKEGNGELRKLKDFWEMITIKQFYGIIK